MIEARAQECVDTHRSEGHDVCGVLHTYVMRFAVLRRSVS